jgi:hypothetical protein
MAAICRSAAGQRAAQAFEQHAPPFFVVADQPGVGVATCVLECLQFLLEGSEAVEARRQGDLEHRTLSIGGDRLGHVCGVAALKSRPAGHAPVRFEAGDKLGQPGEPALPRAGPSAATAALTRSGRRIGGMLVQSAPPRRSPGRRSAAGRRRVIGRCANRRDQCQGRARAVACSSPACRPAPRSPVKDVAGPYGARQGRISTS